MKQLRILDIDLDFFLDIRATGIPFKYKRRLPPKDYHTWPQENVIAFLEKKCALNSKNKIAGKYFTNHDEVFYYLRGLQTQNNFNLKFSIDHVDAHADLGFGSHDRSYKYIFSKVLHLPLNKRCFPKKRGREGLNAGNFLAFTIACRWVKNINYITNIEWRDDLPHFLYKNIECSTNIIQLKKYSPAQMKHILSGTNIIEKMAQTTPLDVEPEIEMRRIDFNAFESDGKYDMIFLTQSPGYTPITSDMLIPVIYSYMNFDVKEE